MALPPLIRSLCRPGALGLPGVAATMEETHISWVLLAGDDVYKIKKPVNFGFLDFSSLERRRHYCQEEIRLNRRLTPELYLDVLPIAGTEQAPLLGGAGAPQEYAVHMRRFDEQARFNRLAQSGRLGAEHVDALADLLADFHSHAPRNGTGAPQAFAQAAEENFIHLLASCPPEPLESLRHWTRERLARLQPVLFQRQQQGRVRECHGDLHLGNIVWHQGRPLPFDCIEFSENLRWLDILNELAFVAMDLEAHGLQDLAWRLLNRYLEHNGDYAGLALWDDYRAYRALVRAKVTVLGAGGALDAAALAGYQRYLGIAQSIAQGRRPWLAITNGLSGSGKTWLSGMLLEALGAVRLRSDVERKRLFGLEATAASGSSLGGGLYSPDATRRTYRHLLDTSATLLGAGCSTIVDATFLKRSDREDFRRLAADYGVPFAILHTSAPDALLRRRIAECRTAGRDASEATLDVLHWQQTMADPLAADELAYTLTVESGSEVDKTAAASAATRLVDRIL